MAAVNFGTTTIVRSVHKSTTSTAADAITLPAGYGNMVRVTNRSLAAATTLLYVVRPQSGTAPSAATSGGDGTIVVMPGQFRDFPIVGTDVNYMSVVSTAAIDYSLEIM